jgi:hypothetical protein
LCDRCAETHTLQFHKEHGVALSPRLMGGHENFLRRAIIAA